MSKQKKAVPVCKDVKEPNKQGALIIGRELYEGKSRFQKVLGQIVFVDKAKL